MGRGLSSFRKLQTSLSHIGVSRGWTLWGKYNEVFSISSITFGRRRGFLQWGWGLEIFSLQTLLLHYYWVMLCSVHISWNDKNFVTRSSLLTFLLKLKTRQKKNTGNFWPGSWVVDSTLHYWHWPALYHTLQLVLCGAGRLPGPCQDRGHRGQPPAVGLGGGELCQTKHINNPPCCLKHSINLNW